MTWPQLGPSLRLSNAKWQSDGPSIRLILSHTSALSLSLSFCRPLFHFLTHTHTHIFVPHPLSHFCVESFFFLRLSRVTSFSSVNSLIWLTCLFITSCIFPKCCSNVNYLKASEGVIFIFLTELICHALEYVVHISRGLLRICCVRFAFRNVDYNVTAVRKWRRLTASAPR